MWPSSLTNDPIRACGWGGSSYVEEGMVSECDQGELVNGVTWFHGDIIMGDISVLTLICSSVNVNELPKVEKLLFRVA